MSDKDNNVGAMLLRMSGATIGQLPSGKGQPCIYINGAMFDSDAPNGEPDISKVLCEISDYFKLLSTLPHRAGELKLNINVLDKEDFLSPVQDGKVQLSRNISRDDSEQYVDVPFVTTVNIHCSHFKGD